MSTLEIILYNEFTINFQKYIQSKVFWQHQRKFGSNSLSLTKENYNTFSEFMQERANIPSSKYKMEEY